MKILRTVVRYKRGQALTLLASRSSRLSCIAYLWESIPIKYIGMHQLPTGEREQQPAAPPPRPLNTAPLAPNPTLILGMVVRKLRRPAQGIYGNRHSKLLGRIHREHESRQTGPDGRGEARRERPASSLIALPEWTRFGREEVRSQACEEAEEDSVEEEDRGYREREPEIGTFPEWLLFAPNSHN
jgi:hypothetical protein